MFISSRCRGYTLQDAKEAVIHAGKVTERIQINGKLPSNFCFVSIFRYLSVTFARKDNLLRIARLVGLFELRITKDLLFLFLSS